MQLVVSSFVFQSVAKFFAEIRNPMNHAAQLANIKQLNRQESDGSTGNFQADEQARITQLSRP